MSDGVHPYWTQSVRVQHASPEWVGMSCETMGRVGVVTAVEQCDPPFGPNPFAVDPDPQWWWVTVKGYD